MLWVRAMCAGQVLVLTHELEGRESQDDYLALALWPARPLLCYGRAAAAYPPAKRKTTVWQWWKECARRRAERRNGGRGLGGLAWDVCVVQSRSSGCFGFGVWVGCPKWSGRDSGRLSRAVFWGSFRRRGLGGD